MRNSVSEVFKLLLAHDHEAYDQRLVQLAQRQVKACGETLKVVRGLCCLADWLVSEHEDGASPTTLMRFCTSPRQLYKTLARVGYTWHEKQRVWRLFANLKRPRRPKGLL